MCEKACSQMQMILNNFYKQLLSAFKMMLINVQQIFKFWLKFATALKVDNIL
jgi:hypothetical protein